MRVNQSKYGGEFMDLSVRTFNALYAAGFRTKAQVVAAIRDGRLVPPNHYRAFGVTAFIEVCKWSGCEDVISRVKPYLLPKGTMPGEPDYQI